MSKTIHIIASFTIAVVTIVLQAGLRVGAGENHSRSPSHWQPQADSEAEARAESDHVDSDRHDSLRFTVTLPPHHTPSTASPPSPSSQCAEAGEWIKGRWTPFDPDCWFYYFNRSAMAQCIHGKHIYVAGNSVSRQLFATLHHAILGVSINASDFARMEEKQVYSPSVLDDTTCPPELRQRYHRSKRKSCPYNVNHDADKQIYRTTWTYSNNLSGNLSFIWTYDWYIPRFSTILAQPNTILTPNAGLNHAWAYDMRWDKKSAMTHLADQFVQLWNASIHPTSLLLYRQSTMTCIYERNQELCQHIRFIYSFINEATNTISSDNASFNSTVAHKARSNGKGKPSVAIKNWRSTASVTMQRIQAVHSSSQTRAVDKGIIKPVGRHKDSSTISDSSRRSLSAHGYSCDDVNSVHKPAAVESESTINLTRRAILAFEKPTAKLFQYMDCNHHPGLQAELQVQLLLNRICPLISDSSDHRLLIRHFPG